LTDELIVEKIVRDSDTALFEIIYDKYSSRIYNQCYAFTKNKDEAKDLTHDLFIKLFLKLKKFNGNSKFSTWVFRIVHNHCINHVKRNASSKYETRCFEFFEIPVFDDAYGSGDETTPISREKICYVLDNLSPEDKSILLLKYQEHYTILDIQKKFNIGASAVKMRIKRARERFVKLYSSHDYSVSDELLNAS
jgi:RNA polymerase sigma-70 factor (ECF subfamily)